MISAIVQTIAMLGGLFLWFSAFALAAILVHEAGHVAAAILFGFRVNAVKAGPIQILMSDSWKWTVSRRRILDGFVQVQFRSVPGRWGVGRCFVFLSGGSVANLCTALLALPLALRDTIMANVFAFFILVSIFVGVVQLIPFEVKGRRSDGAKMLALLSNRTKREDLLFAFSIKARFAEFKALYQAGQLEQALGKLEGLVSGCERTSGFQEIKELTTILSRSRDSLRQYLADAANATTETTTRVD